MAPVAPVFQKVPVEDMYNTPAPSATPVVGTYVDTSSIPQSFWLKYQVLLILLGIAFAVGVFFSIGPVCRMVKNWMKGKTVDDVEAASVVESFKPPIIAVPPPSFGSYDYTYNLQAEMEGRRARLALDARYMGYVSQGKLCKASAKPPPSIHRDTPSSPSATSPVLKPPRNPSPHLPFATPPAIIPPRNPNSPNLRDTYHPSNPPRDPFNLRDIPFLKPPRNPHPQARRDPLPNVRAKPHPSPSTRDTHHPQTSAKPQLPCDAPFLNLRETLTSPPSAQMKSADRRKPNQTPKTRRKSSNPTNIRQARERERWVLCASLENL
ncbi:hypothetical protein FB451DRAFT_1167878 [Mycena latifolia]|nr:hypothetical protein FB451DRAFT_1167878 [Mycena latifolia]